MYPTWPSIDVTVVITAITIITIIKILLFYLLNIIFIIISIFIRCILVLLTENFGKSFGREHANTRSR